MESKARLGKQWDQVSFWLTCLAGEDDSEKLALLWRNIEIGLSCCAFYLRMGRESRCIAALQFFRASKG
ncbi:hypothetical protein SAMN05428978_10126 [Nitrosomonas sp. Nm34]|nr:hypothetical protein SAMN05428978_10126 [Nitrosomonas sp. Nm34]